MMENAVNQECLDRTLAALADPTRRAILQRLTGGEARVTEIARPLPMSLNAVSKHIRVLEVARLVKRRRAGRDHWLCLNSEPLDEAAAWMNEQSALWRSRLSALASLLEEEDRAGDRPANERGELAVTDHTPTTVRVSRQFTQSAERVFDAWLDPAKAGKFLFATPGGQMVRVEIDPRVGGAFCFVDRRDGGDAEHFGEYIEIDRPRRLVFDFAVAEMPEAKTRVTIEIRPVGTGCELTLIHEGVWADYVARTSDGWAMILGGLAAALERD